MADIKNNGNGTVERLIDLRKVAAVVWKNWLVISRDRIRLLPLFVFPFVMVILFGYTAGTAPRHIPAAIVDYDNSPLSLEVQQQLYSNELFSIRTQVGSQDEGKKLLESGQIEALFVIPKGFQDDVQSGKTASLDVMLDQSNPTVAAITSASTQIFVGELSQQINIQRFIMLSKSAQQVQQQLSRIKATLAVTLNRNDEPTLAEMNANFKQGMQLGTQTNQLISGVVQSMTNSLGYVVNPTASINTVGNVTGEVPLYVLAVSDRQQSANQQIQMYQGLQGSNAMMLSSLQSVYGEANAVEAGAQMDQREVRLSYNLIDSTSGEVAQLGADAQSIAQSPTSVVLNQLQPYGNGLTGLDYLLPNILALISFQGAAMGLGRAIAGERRDGSLTRVFLTPTSNITIITGTLLYYVLQESFRTMLIVLAAIAFFGLIVRGSLLAVLFIIMLFALGATGVGMVISVITKSQEQYMAMSMLFTLPMMFLAGVFSPIETMPAALQGVARALPITYAADALRGVMVKGFTLGQVAPDLVFLVGFGFVTMTLSLLLFKRELV